MRERHPIDQHFARRLQGASVEPPASLGAAIIAAANRQRRGLLWRRRIGFIALLLILAAGILRFGPWAPPTPGERIAHQRASNLDGMPPAPQHQGGGASASSTSAHQAIPEQQAQGGGLKARTNQEGLSEARTPNAASSGRAGSGGIPMRSVDGMTRSPESPKASASHIVNLPGSGSQEAFAAEAVSNSHGGSRAETMPMIEATAHASPLRPARMAPLDMAMMLEWPKREMGRQELMGAPRASDYYRPRGTWWVGPMAALHAGRSQWQGGPKALVEALEGSNRWRVNVSGVVLVGRTWPSGVGVWTGIEADRSEQAFRHVERREELREDLVVAQIVTLNAAVVFTDMDTVTTLVVRESAAEGTDRRVRVRVPIEFGWANSMGRWSLGARAGAHLEHTSVRSSGSLVLDEADGFIRSRQLGRGALRARYPMSLSVMAGLDLGCRLSERLSFTAVPFFTLPATTIGARGGAWAEPQRFGLRLQLLHRF